MKIIIAPDKFKGSLTSFEACHAIASGIKSVDTTAEIFSFPMADGGDGFAAVMKYYLHTTTVACASQDPLGRPLTAGYELKGETAVIELASASALVLLSEKERDPLKTSTFGTGLMIQAAIDAGAREIILGLGGSATNDAGTGILAGLGFQFLDKEGRSVKACGGHLIDIRTIIPPPALPACRFVVACDVQNVLYGEEGASYVYAPQKGATSDGVALLDEGLRHFAGLLQKDVANIPGTGAAGGIAAGLMGFFDVRLEKGIHLVMDRSGIMNRLHDAGIVVTGEGKIDKQTAFGKVVGEIALAASRYHIPVMAFCGLKEIEKDGSLRLDAIREIAPPGMPIDEAMSRAGELLKSAAADYFK
ncbi:MAG TPA: glycerate kinase [Puia sp.]